MALLLIHGAPGDARLWTPVIDALPATIDARAITLDCFGSDARPDDGASVGTMRHSDDIVSYVEAAMEAPVDLVAWSFGCHPALLAAIERPELFRSLVFYEPSLNSDVDDPAAKAAFGDDRMAAISLVMAAMGEDDDQRAHGIIVDNAGTQAAGPRVPVTIGCGAETRPKFSFTSRALAEAIPYARYAEVPGAGHMLPETEPVRFAALLHQWLEDMA